MKEGDVFIFAMGLWQTEQPKGEVPNASKHRWCLL